VDLSDGRGSTRSAVNRKDFATARAGRGDLRSSFFYSADAIHCHLECVTYFM